MVKNDNHIDRPFFKADEVNNKTTDQLQAELAAAKKQRDFLKNDGIKRMKKLCGDILTLKADNRRLKKHIHECMIYRMSALGCMCGYMKALKRTGE